MKRIEVWATAILFLLLGAIASVYAQGQREQEKQPEQKQQQQARPAQRQQQANPAQQPQRAQQQQARPAQQPQQPQHQQQARPVQQPQQAQHQQQARPVQQPQQAQHQQQARPVQPPQQAQHQQQARPVQQPQRAQDQQRASRAQPAANQARIPDDRFRASFGRGHTFHVNRSEFAGGSRRFQYGGFWFAMVDPWPVGWLYTDSVYVDYLNGGYFLCDPVHPGVFISINIG